MKYDLTVISLGAGIQSTALSICSAAGLHGVPKADGAVFANTQDELPDTYEHLSVLSAWMEDGGIPVRIGTQGHLGDHVLNGRHGDGRKSSFETIPAFTMSPEGKRGELARYCTRDYKLRVIKREIRKMLGLKPGQVAKGRFKVRSLIGISLDEAHRMKDATDDWMENAYPLVDAKLTREDCKKIITDHGFALPTRSACYYCPYHRNDYWGWLKRERPEQFARAVDFDRKIRDYSRAGVVQPVYLHDSLRPLEEIDFENECQLSLDGFGNECEGMCGV